MSYTEVSTYTEDEFDVEYCPLSSDVISCTNENHLHFAEQYTERDEAFHCPSSTTKDDDYLNKNRCEVAIYISLGLGLGLCFGLLLAFLIKVDSLEFDMTSNYVETKCTVIHSNYTGHRVSCICGKRCVSDYPCITNFVVHNITVNVNTQKYALPANASEDSPAASSATFQKTIVSTIYESEEDRQAGECSFHPPMCAYSSHMNDLAVVNYDLEWGTPRTTFSCLRHRTHPEFVIHHAKEEKVWVLVHLAFWPILVCVCLIIGIVVTYRRYGCDACCSCLIDSLPCHVLSKLHWRNRKIAMSKLQMTTCDR